MTPTKLGTMLETISDSIVNKSSQWQFIIKNTPFIAIADSTHNRMRIMSPIIQSDKLSENLKTASLMANFHTALDVKYAISDDILWSVFIHPLKELSEKQVIDAVAQVYNANRFNVDLNAYPIIQRVNDNCLMLKEFIDALPENQEDCDIQ